MNDGIIITQVYDFWNQESYKPMLDLVKPMHQAYAAKHRFDYMTVVGPVKKEWGPNTGGWAKIELIRQVLWTDKYKYICWIDADAAIINDEVDLRTGCPPGAIGMVQHNGPGTPGPHLNVGVILIGAEAKLKPLFEEWVSRYPGTTEFPWYEQGEIHKMRKDPKWAEMIKEIEPKWNSCLAGSNHTDEMVIEGWHGMGTGAQRFYQMNRFLHEIGKIPNESEASQAQVSSLGR